MSKKKIELTPGLGCGWYLVLMAEKYKMRKYLLLMVLKK